MQTDKSIFSKKWRNKKPNQKKTKQWCLQIFVGIEELMQDQCTDTGWKKLTA